MPMTCLNLLSRDGALSVTFRPRLSPDEYDELYRLIPLIDTRDQMIEVLLYFAKTHVKEVIFD